MGQAGSTANCGCIESILTGSTKREQFLEQQCTELARQNELLRNRLEQSSRSVDAASPNLNLSRQSSGNHHRKSLSAYKSLGGSSGNLAAAAAPSTANLSSVAEGSPGGRADTAANRRRSERSSSKMEQGQLATLAVTAAAQEAADYQSSLVSVSINNEAYETKTEVTVRAPNRERLLADMNGALSGLGLLVHDARFTSGDLSEYAAYVFVVQDSNGHKVLERSRLEAIRQRLQQKYWGSQGLNGGVRRLVVDRYIAARPPWEHDALEPQEPPQLQIEVWLAALTTALLGGSSLGALPPALATRLAADLLPEMRRIRLRAGGEIVSEATEGEWLLLIEGHARVTTETEPRSSLTSKSPAEIRRHSSSPTKSPGNSQHGGSFFGDFAAGGAAQPDSWMTPLCSGSASPTPLSSGGSLVFGYGVSRSSSGLDEIFFEAAPAAARTPTLDQRLEAGAGAGAASKQRWPVPAYTELPPGSVLWEEYSKSQYATAASPSVMLRASRRASAASAAGERRWSVLHAGPEGIPLRVLHLNTVRSRLAALRESLARQHSQILADTAVFAPLDTPRLLALCRRATLVEAEEGMVLLEAGHGGSSDGEGGRPLAASAAGVDGPDLAAFEITDTTFGLVIDGELQMCLSLPDQHRQAASLPELLPLARLGPRSTFGEMGALTGLGCGVTRGVSMRSEGGATLLCWPRDAFLLGELQQLVGDSKDGTKRPSIIEGSWLARTPLAALVDLPHLASCLRPTLLSRLQVAHARGALSSPSAVTMRPTDTMLVLDGEVTKNPHPDAMLEVHLLTEANGGVPDKYAGGDALNGQLELVVAARLPSRCTTNGAVAGLSAGLSDLGLRVTDANLSLTRDIALNAFHVILPPESACAHGGAPRPAEVRAREVQARIQALQASTMRPGDAMPLLSEDGTSRIPRLAHPTEAALALVDLRQFSALLAQPPPPSGAGSAEDDKRASLATLWRRFAEANAPNLQLQPSVEGAPVAPLQPPQDLSVALAPGAADAAGDAGGDVPGGQTGGWYATLCAFNLFRMRQQTNEPEVGVEVQDLELGPKLGEGGYGVVHLARHRVSGTLFAVKSFTKAKIRRIEERTTYMRLERERKTLRLMQAHLRGGAQPYNLVRLVCSGHDPEWLRLVLPFYGGGDLSRLLDESKLTTEAVQFYAGCVILALTQLHSLEIVYRDLKPENILLTAQGWPVLTDFGLVAFLDEGRATSMVGTPEFMPPEIVSGTGHGTDADWWSLGVTLCELLTLTTPFCEPEAASNHERTYANIVRGRFSKSFEQKEFRLLPKHTAAMLSGLLKLDPPERLGGTRRGTESIRCHPFFWGLNWEALEARELAPPYAAHCQASNKAITTKFDESARAGTLMVLPQSMRPKSREEGEGNAAAAAMDKMFDFSSW